LYAVAVFVVFYFLPIGLMDKYILAQGQAYQNIYAYKNAPLVLSFEHNLAGQY